MGSAPIEATKLAIFPDKITCDQHLSDLKPIIDTWVLQGWYKSLISLSGHGDFAEYVVPRADDIVC
jgi:hypothetical protein